MKQEIIRKQDVKMEMYVVYNSPSDFPGKFVVRRRFIMNDGRDLPEKDPTFVGESYLECLRYIPLGKTAMDPVKGSDKKSIYKIFI